MKNTSHNILFHFFRGHLETMRSLPEHVRKIFMVVTMIFATTFVGLFSWLLFPPLQNVGLPSLQNTNQQAINGYQAMDDLKQIVKNNEFANVIKVPEIGPTSGFMQSFKAVRDLVVPKNLQNPLEHVRTTASWPPSWLAPFSYASADIALKFREVSAPALEKVNEFFARLPSYISHLIDLLVSSISRMTI